jgi:8-oxo-dGTP pyrophosphatase MutT (NUDIX family)
METKHMQPWKTLSRQTILNHSKFLIVEDHTIQLPDGQLIANWPWLVTPDYVIVVAVTSEGKFLCFRQTKYAVNGTTLAPVGGYLEPGEEPLTAAMRELLEETGYESSDWLNLGNYRVDGNHGAGMAHLYLARQAQYVTEPHSDDLEEQQLLHLNQAEMEAALVGGEFKILAWTTVVALAFRHLLRDAPNSLT